MIKIRQLLVQTPLGTQRSLGTSLQGPSDLQVKTVKTQWLTVVLYNEVIKTNSNFLRRDFKWKKTQNKQFFPLMKFFVHKKLWLLLFLFTCFCFVSCFLLVLRFLCRKNLFWKNLWLSWVCPDNLIFQYYFSVPLSTCLWRIIFTNFF